MSAIEYPDGRIERIVDIEPGLDYHPLKMADGYLPSGDKKRKAQVCLAGPDSRAGIVSVDAEGGRLVAISRVEFRDAERVGLAKGRLAVEAGEGAFQVVLGNLGIRQGAADVNGDEVFQPLAMRPDSGWEPALAALIGVEQALVDCMFL